MNTCCVCGFSKNREDSKMADFWYLTGFMNKFWGCWCRKCFHDISQTPNHKIIDKERYSKTAVRYRLKNRREL